MATEIAAACLLLQDGAVYRSSPHEKSSQAAIFQTKSPGKLQILCAN